jgi:hypothetical protein
VQSISEEFDAATGVAFMAQWKYTRLRRTGTTPPLVTRMEQGMEVSALPASASPRIESDKSLEGEPTLVKAVLKAADDWVSGLEALVAVQQVSNETEAEHDAVDIAGTRLVLAVTRWRSERKG